MQKFNVSTSDFQEFINILNKNKLSYWVDYIKRYGYGYSNAQTLDNLSFLTNKHILKNKKFLTDLYLYTKDKNCNIIEYYEDKLKLSYSNGEILLAYNRLVKSKVYQPSDKTIYDLIQTHNPSNFQIYWGMLFLASLIKDNDLCLKAFYLISDSKVAKLNALSLLDIEKIKRAWDKRFKGVNVETLPKKEYDFLVKLFDNINESKTKAFCSTTNGSYLKILVDIDIISQETRLSKKKNYDALNSFFNEFSTFIVSKEAKDNILSIDDVFVSEDLYSDMSFNVIIYYSDSSKTELIKKVIGELVSYAVVKDKDGKLQATKDDHNNKFFSSFIMNYNLETSLDKKDEVKVKKEKI